MSGQIFPADALGLHLISREPFTNVLVDEAVSGKEARSSWQSTPRYRYQFGVSVTRADTRLDFQRFLSHFARHFGKLDSFLLRDEEDYAVTDHGFGVGDGATVAFQLQRSMLGTKHELGLGGPYVVSSKPRTNLCLQSQTFGTTWAVTRATVSANSVIAPDGTKTADTLVEDATATSTHLISQSITFVSGTAYTLSVYAKASTRTKLTINVASEAAVGSFDLTAGTATSWSGTAAITDCGGGWFRCELRWTAAASAARTCEIYLDGGTPPAGAYSGDGASGLYLWGAQVEAATSATKYIVTTTAAAISNPSYWPSYTDGFEPVRDLIPASLLVYKNGALQPRVDDATPPAPGAGNYSVSSTGLVTFGTAPSAADVLSWTGTYYRRVRFAGEGMAHQWLGSRMWAIPTVDLVSVI